MVSFALLETMRAQGGTAPLLRRHLERLNRSAAHFGFVCDLKEIQATIEKAARQTASPACLRLVLERNGAATIEVRPIPARNPHQLRIAPFRVNSSDPLLYHKTTERGLYERARSGMNEDTDAILVNERLEVTETTIANIALFRRGRWMTPPGSCGLLAGAMRAELLDKGEIVEGVIALDDLVAGESARCFNALRGLFEARIQL
jgi:para-aminobenzoate synthetase/4-amino-4-deoxychorismate lyase